MSLVLDLPEEVEQQVRREAERVGLAPQVYLLQILEKSLSREASLPPRLSSEETALLLQLDLGLSDKTWARYHHLTELLRAKTLSDSEHQELLELTDTIEMANARRIKFLVELAKVRGMALPDLMDELGIQSPGYA